MDTEIQYEVEDRKVSGNIDAISAFVDSVKRMMRKAVHGKLRISYIVAPHELSIERKWKLLVPLAEQLVSLAGDELESVVIGDDDKQMDFKMVDGREFSISLKIPDTLREKLFIESEDGNIKKRKI